MMQGNQNGKKGDAESKIVLRGKLKSFYDLCMIVPKIPSRVIHGVSSAVDDDNMIELRRTSLSNVYVHPVTCSTLPESAFEYFTESDVSEPIEGTINEDPSLTMEDAVKVSSECPESTLNNNTIEPLVMSNSMFSKSTQLKHRTHYVKLTLRDANLSFRYFFESEDNKHQEGFWWLKDHKNKSSIQVNKEFIRKHYEDIVDMHEIIGRHVFKKGYMKIIKNLRTNELVEIKDA